MSGKDAASRKNQNHPWKRRLTVATSALSIVGAAIVIRAVWGPDSASADAARTPAKTAEKAPPAEPPKLQIMAVVNGQEITRTELARECLAHYGRDVLESLVNKHLIEEHCRQRKITITAKEVDVEIDRNAERFGLPTEQWLKLLKEEREVTPEQYAKDIIWPTIALRKLAESRIQVTQQDLQQAYDTQFGPAVQVRVITTTDAAKAQELHAHATKNPADFGNLAKEKSEDPSSASAKGLIQPIRLHAGDPKIEQVAFQLREGEISEIVATSGQFVIMKCEAHIRARQVPMQQVEKLLVDAIRDKKLRLVAKDVFEELQKASVVENVFNDPQKRAQFPNVAATINGHPITMEQLADECIERHGKEVLTSLISQKLVEQAAKRRGIQVSQPELDAEVVHTAMLVEKPLPDGRPNVDAWRKRVVEEQGMSWETYIREVVWPAAVMKKLAGAKIEVSEEDLKKGYEANYGPRVRCRAIVLNHQRRAQEVWEMARKIPSIENLSKHVGGRQTNQPPTAEMQAMIQDAVVQFGKLANQFSTDASTSVLDGEIPPVQKHGGKPKLEDEAFTLRAGELSGITQVDDKFVILFCEGQTKPVASRYEDVRKLLFEDIHEKKVRLAMAQEFAKLQESAQIDNYLAGTSQSSAEERALLERMTGKDAADPLLGDSPRKPSPAIRQSSATRPAAPPAPAPVRR